HSSQLVSTPTAGYRTPGNTNGGVRKLRSAPVALLIRDLARRLAPVRRRDRAALCSAHASFSFGSFLWWRCAEEKLRFTKKRFVPHLSITPFVLQEAGVQNTNVSGLHGSRPGRHESDES